MSYFFFNDTATTEIYTLSLHDALPISEEGELRPQLLDRFGLSVEVRTPEDLPTRVEVVRRRDAFERDPEGFGAAWAKEEAATRRRIEGARLCISTVAVPDTALEAAARLCMAARK